jgi:hypothetical protein
MFKKNGVGYLVIAKSTVSIVESVVCQTSRGAVIAFAVLGIALPFALEVHHHPQVARAPLSKISLSQHVTDHSAG